MTKNEQPDPAGAVPPGAPDTEAAEPGVPETVRPEGVAAADGRTVITQQADAPLASISVPTSPNLTLPAPPIGDYTPEGIPTFDYLRDKLDRRLGTALRSVEIAEAAAKQAAAGRAQAQADRAADRADDRAASVARQQFREQQRAQQAADKLAEIRRSLHPSPQVSEGGETTGASAVRTVDPDPGVIAAPPPPAVRDIDRPDG